MIAILRYTTWLALSLSMTGAKIFAQAVEKPVREPQTAAQVSVLVSEMMRIRKLAGEAQARGNALTALDALREIEARSSGAQDPTIKAVAEVSLHRDAVVGNYREALRHFAIGSGSERPSDQPGEEYPLRGLRALPALSVLDPEADGAQVVMINEAHHVPQHRAFSIELLHLLWNKGFRYFAAETLAPDDAQLHERGYPTQATGYYTEEPVYGNLVRTALRLGFRIIPYEAVAFANPAEREQGQADNLVDRIFRNDPHAKVVIHAGYAHINETGLLAGAPTMAQRLAAMTGLNPLTIDQTVMSEQFTEEYEHPVYRQAMAHETIAQPTIFVNAQGKPWTAQPGVRDITLFHPRSVYVQGRPTWLALGGRRIPHALPAGICVGADRCLVQAHLAGEPADAIPVDQVEIADDRHPPALMLPHGEFNLDVQDPLGKSLQMLRVEMRGD